jgi:transcriptional regulator with XRE-family HTH domain
MALSGERLKDLRERRGVTQEALAATVGISVRLLQKYEAGENDPSTDNAAKLAEALTTTIDYLADRVPDSAPYIQGDLSLLERLVIFLLRRNKLPPSVEAAINEAIKDPSENIQVSKEHTARNQKLLQGGKRAKPS